MAIDGIDTNQEAVWLTKYTVPKMNDSTLSMINQTGKMGQMSVGNESRSSDFSSIHTFFEKKAVDKPAFMKNGSSRPNSSYFNDYDYD